MQILLVIARYSTAVQLYICTAVQQYQYNKYNSINTGLGLTDGNNTAVVQYTDN